MHAFPIIIPSDYTFRIIVKLTLAVETRIALYYKNMFQELNKVMNVCLFVPIMLTYEII